MRPVVLSLLCAIPLSLLAQSHSSLALARDDRVRAIFADLLRRGWNGLRQTESAAFIVIDEAGCYGPVFWPDTGVPARQSWRGAAPPFTVAIAHTHPRALRRPSATDQGTARAEGIPVFVLTPTDIYAATPEGAVLALVEQREWARDVIATRECPRPRPPRQALAAE